MSRILFKGKIEQEPLMKRNTPKLSPSLTDGLRKLGLADDPAAKSFFGGTLGDYIKTPAGKEKIEQVISDDKVFNHYLQALKIEGAIDHMVNFLKTKEGVETFVNVCERKEGLHLMIKIGQTDEGREIGTRMLTSPSCWGPVIRIIKGIRALNPITDDEPDLKQRFDFSGFRDSQDGVKKLIPYLQDETRIDDIFIALTQSKEDAKFCKKVLGDEEARRIIFGYITGNRDSVIDVFKTLFKSKKRRNTMSGVFASNGGVKLLSELAEDKIGKEMLAELATTSNGMNVGWKAVLKGSLARPIMIIEVGKAYFSAPKTGQHVLEIILSAVLRFISSI